MHAERRFETTAKDLTSARTAEFAPDERRFREDACGRLRSTADDSFGLRELLRLTVTVATQLRELPKGFPKAGGGRSRCGASGRLLQGDEDDGLFLTLSAGQQASHATVERRQPPSVAEGQLEQVSVGHLSVTDDLLKGHEADRAERDVVGPKPVMR